MGVEPTRDGADRPASVLKTVEDTGPLPLPCSVRVADLVATPFAPSILSQAGIAHREPQQHLPISSLAVGVVAHQSTGEGSYTNRYSLLQVLGQHLLELQQALNHPSPNLFQSFIIVVDAALANDLDERPLDVISSLPLKRVSDRALYLLLADLQANRSALCSYPSRRFRCRGPRLHFRSRPSAAL